jgi:hypothetical protein
MPSFPISPTRSAFVAALAAGALVALGADAQAAVTCSFNGGSLTTQSSTPIDETRIVRSGDNIVVTTRNEIPVTCNGQATVHNTHVIAHTDNSGGESYFTIDLRGGPFSPGETNEAGNSDEIDIQAVMGSGRDRLYVWGGPGNDFWRLGQTANGIGVNLNADLESGPGETPNSDVDLREAELLVLLSGQGDDRVLAGGGPEFSGPIPMRADVNGGDGDDELVGGSGPDNFHDGLGRDVVRGGADGDSIAEYKNDSTGEDDTFEGGPGNDHVAWVEFTEPMRVDLRLAGGQDTGAAGRDSVSGFENASISNADAVLIGTDGDNRLSTGDGSDLIAGLGGDDTIDAGSGNDTASYATPPAGVTRGVTVDLTAIGSRQDTGGAGVDRIEGVANLIGSPFPDVLFGNMADNRFDVRDGTADKVICDGGNDSVIADAEGTDDVGNCETTRFNPRPDTRIDAGPPTLTRDATPSFRFAATKQGSTFECSLDGAAFRACDSAHTLPRVRNGAHNLRVRARDMLGATDLSPAQRAFSVDASRPRITRVRISKGGRLRYRLSEAATVRIAVKKGKAVIRKGKTGANRAALPRSIRRAKARGARITLTATDRAGNRSRPVRLR